MSVGSSSPLVHTGSDSKVISSSRLATPEGKSRRDQAAGPRIKVQVPRSASKREVRTANRANNSKNEHTLPMLKGRKAQPGHQRQHSAPNVLRNNKPDPSPRHQREKQWIAEFDELEGLQHGQIEVRLDSEEQFNAFLNWLPARSIHAIKINNSLAGFERDFQTLHSLGLTEEFREEPGAEFFQILKNEYAAFPGIVNILCALPALQSLDISRCDPSEPDLLQLLQGLKEDRFKLSSLQADHIYWGDQLVVESLLRYLAGPTCLKKLSIQSATGNKLTSHRLLTALRANDGLQEVSLSVSGNKGAVDPEDIALTIFLNSSLKKLSVSVTRIFFTSENIFLDEKPNGFEISQLVIYHFMSAFVKNTTLEVLSIRGAALPAEIIDAITESIGENSAIQAIELEENEENRLALQRLQSLLRQRQIRTQM